MAYGARLESVLSESSQGFESPILRRSVIAPDVIAHCCHLTGTIPRPQRCARKMATLKHDEHRRTFSPHRTLTLTDSR